MRALQKKKKKKKSHGLSVLWLSGLPVKMDWLLSTCFMRGFKPQMAMVRHAFNMHSVYTVDACPDVSLFFSLFCHENLLCFDSYRNRRRNLMLSASSSYQIEACCQGRIVGQIKRRMIFLDATMQTPKAIWNTVVHKPYTMASPAALCACADCNSTPTI